MKNLFTKVTLGAVLLLSPFIGKADSLAVSLDGKSTNLVIVGPLQLRNISMSSSSTTNGLIAFLDSGDAFPTNYIGPVTNYVRSTVITNQIFTNVFGVLTTNRYTAISNSVNTVAGSMKNKAVIGSASSVSNAVVTLDFDTVFVANGILVTNIAGVGAPGNITVTFQYDRLK